MLDGASYLARVVGEVVSSRELRRASAALSRNIAARVEEVGAGSAGFGATTGFVTAGFTFDGSSSVSDSSSELDSSSEEDSSFLTLFAAAGWVDDCKKRD